jgi:membrane protease YdiL (CAAX protease family)
MPDAVEEEAPAEVQVRPEAVAPWPHTLFIVVVLALWAMYGAMRWRVPTNVVPISLRYAVSIIMQYLLVGSTIAGLYHRRRFLSGVFGQLTAQRILPELGNGFLTYIGGCAVMLAIGLAIRPMHLLRPKGVVQAIAPHSPWELVLWMLVSVTAGLCEEFVFRGYLLRQVTRWFGSPAIAIGVTAILFGCMHFYEGTGAVIEIAGLGVLYGIVAARRGNLRSVIVAHFLQDAITGLILFLRSSGT